MCVSPECLSLYPVCVVVLGRDCGALGLDCRTLPLLLQVSVSFSRNWRNRDRLDDWEKETNVRLHTHRLSYLSLPKTFV